MLEIEGHIVSEELLTEGFACDIKACRGQCCVEGNSGAPLAPDEPEWLEKHFADYAPFLTEAGRKVLETQGFSVIDADGDLTTPLVGDAECAYVYTENGTTMCAVEKAAIEGFPKPISCHLYPIRLIEFSNGTVGLNYHRWEVCKAARKSHTKAYRSLREPIVRRFGEEFYRALEIADQLLRYEKNR